MAKVGKAYTLDVEVVQMLERYCAASETWDKRRSRSKVVNDAIRWFLTGDTAEQIHSHEELLTRYRDVCIELASYKQSNNQDHNRPWWKRLLGLKF